MLIKTVKSMVSAHSRFLISRKKLMKLSTDVLELKKMISAIKKCVDWSNQGYGNSVTDYPNFSDSGLYTNESLFSQAGG